MLGKNKWAMVVAEFLGTYVLVSAVMALFVRTSFPFFAAAAAGVALASMVLVVGKFSGAHLNPAVTVGLWSVKKFPTADAVAYIAVQMLAGFTALRVNQYLLGQTLSGSVTQSWEPSVVIAEVLGAFVLAFGLAAMLENAYEGGKAAAVAGTSLFLGVLVASFGSSGAINPAVALGVNSMSVSYVVGPLVGAVLAFNLYSYLFAAAPAKTVSAGAVAKAKAAAARPKAAKTAATRTKTTATKTKAARAKSTRTKAAPRKKR
jgi:glycerol uptake facilitator-like aquaporin